MDTDFPAAHSMDTGWFAVDADGAIGCFRTHDSSAVPLREPYEVWRARQGDWQRGQGESYEVWRGLAASLTRCEAIYDLQGNLTPGPRAEAERHAYTDRGTDYAVLAFLESLDPVRRQIASGNAIPVIALSCAAVIFRSLHQSVARRLHKEGHCLGCFYCPMQGQWLDLGEEGPSYAAQVGLYYYTPVVESRIPFFALPYGRKQVPAHPAHINQLRPRLRAEVRRLRFETLRFAETAHIQPCETEDVACWDSAYLTADGQHIREIRNNLRRYPEATYEEFYRDMTERKPDWLNGILIDPPRRG
jgi:hypothetical protein